MDIRKKALLTAGLLTVAVLVPGVASAGTGGITKVATGLDNPRGLSFGLDGSLYVAEGGRGGNLACFAGAEGETCLGESGAITRVSQGKQERVLTGLPSLAAPNGTNALGPTDIAPWGAGFQFTTGLGSNPATRATLPAPAANTGRVLRSDGFTRHVSRVADIAGYEAKVNPDGAPPDSNPTSLTVTPWGTAVVDAGGNSLVGVSPGGRLSTLAVFPADGGVQAVPTSVAQGPDGAFYVGQLTGVPFAPGSAKVFRVVPGQQPTVYAEGFTNIIDLAVDHRGSVYVLELAKNGLASGDPAGALIQVTPDGVHRTVADTGLITPGGVALRGDAAYVSNCGTCAGGGEVLRIPLQ